MVCGGDGRRFSFRLPLCYFPCFPAKKGGLLSLCSTPTSAPQCDMLFHILLIPTWWAIITSIIRVQEEKKFVTWALMNNPILERQTTSVQERIRHCLSLGSIFITSSIWGDQVSPGRSHPDNAMNRSIRLTSRKAVLLGTFGQSVQPSRK